MNHISGTSQADYTSHIMLLRVQAQREFDPSQHQHAERHCTTNRNHVMVLMFAPNFEFCQVRAIYAVTVSSECISITIRATESFCLKGGLPREMVMARKAYLLIYRPHNFHRYHTLEMRRKWLGIPTFEHPSWQAGCTVQLFAVALETSQILSR